eukprot:5283715-Lingulodinium_polyedra.AAC.1
MRRLRNGARQVTDPLLGPPLLLELGPSLRAAPSRHNSGSHSAMTCPLLGIEPDIVLDDSPYSIGVRAELGEDAQVRVAEGNDLCLHLAGHLALVE